MPRRKKNHATRLKILELRVEEPPAYARPWLTRVQGDIQQLRVATLELIDEVKTLSARSRVVFAELQKAKNGLSSQLRRAFNTHGHIATASDEPALLRVYDYALIATGADVTNATKLVDSWMRELPSKSTVDDLVQRAAFYA